MNIRNPRTGQFDYHISIPSDADIATACKNLRSQQPLWAAANIAERIDALQQWKSEVEKRKHALIAALEQDTGRRWETALEADLVAASIDRWCRIAKDFFTAPEVKNSSIPFIQLQQDVVPFQLIGVISPWNFPLLLSLIDTIPALLAGCSVIVKPSEATPRFIEVVQQSIDAVPALKKVLQYTAGDGATGAAIVNNVDLVCFTGSTATGKKVYDAASKRMIPVFLELGGKDPALIFEGADLAAAAAAVLWGSTANAGQSCLSIERVYVQETVYDQFLDLLLQKAKSVKLNATNIADGQIGPIIFEKQVHIINDQLKNAIEKGAHIVHGHAECQQIGGGWYLPPTIVTQVNHDMKLMQEETFGPVLPVMAFANEAEAVALANETIYGLSGAVFAHDNETAIRIAQQLECGAVSINDAALTAVMHEGEKASFRLSGIGGTRMGPAAIKRFMRQKVYIIKNGAMDSPWWYR